MDKVIFVFIGILILTLSIVDLIIRAKIREHARYMEDNYREDK
jgi:hypothetical protein